MKPLRSALPALVLALLPLLATAAEGAYEINQDCAEVGCFLGDAPGFPVQITAPGRYVLSSDLAVSTNAVGITVAASPVDLDLAGHTIDGGGSCIGAPVSGCTQTGGLTGVSAAGSAGAAGALHLHDGTIRGFTNTSTGVPSAIYFNNAGDGALIERLTVLENGGNGAITVNASLAATVRLRDVQIVRNKAYGVACASGSLAGLVIETATFSANGIYGAALGNCKNSVISGSRFLGNGNQAITSGAVVIGLGGNAFGGNNSAGLQYSIGTVRDMGGNTCLDHASGACP